VSHKANHAAATAVGRFNSNEAGSRQRQAACRVRTEDSISGDTLIDGDGQLLDCGHREISYIPSLASAAPAAAAAAVVAAIQLLDDSLIVMLSRTDCQTD